MLGSRRAGRPLLSATVVRDLMFIILCINDGTKMDTRTLVRQINTVSMVMNEAAYIPCPAQQRRHVWILSAQNH